MLSKSYRSAIATIGSEIESLCRQKNSLQEQINNLSKYKSELEADLDQALRSEFIEQNGVTRIKTRKAKSSSQKSDTEKLASKVKKLSDQEKQDLMAMLDLES